MAEDHEGIPENQVTYYKTQGHNHDGENSTLIDFSKYDLGDIIDLSQFNAAVLGTIENNTIRGKIFLQPTRTVEFISLDFVVTNAGATG